MQTPVDAPRRRLAVWAFSSYLFLLAWVVLFKLQAPFIGSGVLRTLKLVPFAADGANGSSSPMELALNVLIFVPVGLYLPLLWHRLRWTGAILTGLVLSLLFETLQFVLALGSSDVTDLFSNISGTLIGHAVACWVIGLRGGRGPRRLAGICVGVTSAALVLCLLFASSPLRYAPVNA